MKKRSFKSPEPEWSFLAKVEDISPSGRSFSLEATADQCEALAERFDLLRIDRLKADIKVLRESGPIFHAMGRIRAKIEQACIVTLDPVITDIDDEFEAWYADESQAVSFRRARHEAQGKKELLEVPMLEESEDPEPVTDGQIDLGDLASQYFSLSIPPYPCKEGVQPQSELPVPEHKPGDSLKVNPFAALKNWRPKD